MHYPDVYILRHGQTEWNVNARLQGRFDSPLTDKGRAQATHQGALLSDFWLSLDNPSAISSPLGRAEQTAQIALSGLNAELTTDLRLREISAGSWDGLYLEDIERTNGPLFEQARNSFELMFLAPDGEGEEAVITRCRDFLTDLNGPSILITHGATLCVLRGILRGLRFEETLDLDHEQGCIYAIKNGVETILR